MGVYGGGVYGSGTYGAAIGGIPLDPEDARLSRVAAGQEQEVIHPRTFAMVDPAVQGTFAWRGGVTFTFGPATTGGTIVTRDAELAATLARLTGFVES